MLAGGQKVDDALGDIVEQVAQRAAPFALVDGADILFPPAGVVAIGRSLQFFGHRLGMREGHAGDAELHQRGLPFVERHGILAAQGFEIHVLIELEEIPFVSLTAFEELAPQGQKEAIRPVVVGHGLDVFVVCVGQAEIAARGHAVVDGGDQHRPALQTADVDRCFLSAAGGPLLRH